MTLRRYLWIMVLATVICWLIWIYVFFTVNPEITNWIGFILFYSSLFVAILGTAALTGFMIRFVILRRRLAWQLVKEAFRQSFLFSSLIIISLLLLSRGLFSWLNLIFLIIGLSVLEFFLLSYEKPY
ncbi:hypothetical protein K8R32_00455 [bacterium]|nr:hypothetical protein [bacterium]